MQSYICPGCDGTGIQHADFVVGGVGEHGLGAMITSSAQDMGGGIGYGVGFDGQGFTPVYTETRNFTCTICGGYGRILG